MKNFLNILISFAFSFIFSQNSLNGVAVVVGNDVITYLDINMQVALLEEQGAIPFDRYEKTKSLLLESLIDRFVLLDFAIKDSLVVVGDEEVDNQLNLQIQSFVENLGSEDALENYFGKKINKIKEDYWIEVYNNMLIERYKYSLVSLVDVGKKEIEIFYEEYKDSLESVPLNANIDIINIPLLPSKETVNKKMVWLSSIKDSVDAGLIDFEQAITKHTELPNYGLVGYTSRGTLFEEYERAAYSANIGDLVGPIKTSAGAHLIKVLDKKGEKVKTQHLLVKIKATPEDRKKTKSIIDSYYEQLKVDPLFIKTHLDSKEGPFFGYTGSHQNIFLSSFSEELGELVLGLEEGGLVAPSFLRDESVVIVKLHELFQESKPTLENSYQYIAAMAKENKQNSVLRVWLKNAKKNTYIDIK